MPRQAAVAANAHGKALVQQGRRDAATAAFRAAVQHDPSLAEAHNNLGNMLNRVPPYADAIAEYQAAIALMPDYFEAHFNLGNTLRRAGQAHQAVAVFQAAVALRPAIPAVYTGLGNALLDADRAEEAVAAFRAVIRQQPDHAVGYNNLAVALRKAGAVDAALAALDRAIALQPGYALAHGNRGMILRERGAYEPALAALWHALHLAPESPDHPSQYFSLMRDLGRVHAAIPLCAELIARAPGNAAAQQEMAELLLTVGRVDDAYAAVRQEQILAPNRPETLNTLGNILREQGQLAEALHAYRQALALKPDAIGIRGNLVFSAQFATGVDAVALRAEAALIGQSAEQRERELAALRTIRGLITAGKAPGAESLTETQQALVEQSKQIASANYALKQQQSLYDGIANAASQAFDQVGTAIANAFVGGQRAAINWGNVASSIIASVLQQVMKLAVINPVLNSVLGTSMPAVSLSGGGGSGLFSGLGSLFGGSGSATGFMATPLWGADVAGPVTAGGITASGAPTLGAMFGGVGAGFGAGMLLNSLVGGNQLGGTIGSGAGAMAGAAIGSIIPGIGTLIGGLIGGAAGGGLGGMFGPGPKHHGWSWTLGSDDAGMIGFRTANVDPVAQQQFAQEQQQVAAFNTWMQQAKIKAAGTYIVGGNNDPNLEHDYASFAAGFNNLRFSAANDNRLNTALSGRAFTDPNQLADFTTFLTQTMAILEKAPLNDFATALKGVNDTYDAAIKKAQDYALAEGDLTAGLQARYLRATGGTAQADLLAFDTAAAQERQQMTDQILAMGLASTQYAADRMVDIERTLAAERLAIQEKYAADSKRASQSLLTELTIGNQSALAPEQRYFAGLSLLNNARHNLDTGGALSDFTAVAQQVLPVARDFLGTSERYAALVAEVAGAVASKGGDPAGLSTLLQAQVDGTDALRDVFARYGDQQLTVASATLSELRRLASVLEALMARSLAA